MDWNSNNLKHLVSRPECSFGFLYNYNNYDQHLGLMEEKHNLMVPEIERRIDPNMEEKSNMSYGYSGQEIKKKRLSSEQLESLERSFQEEIKLDPDRKLKLSRELGLQPRQIAVWFQNRRARWKAKKLEHLYDSLKQEFDAIFNEKQKLQEEVMELKAILRDQATQKLVSGGYTEISGDETVESTFLAIGNFNKSQGTNNQFHIPAGCNYAFNVEECSQVSANYNWGNLPYYP